MCTTIYVLRKNIIIFHLKVIIFTAVKNCCILHMRVFVMCSLAERISLREEEMEREKQGKFLSTC